MRRIVEHLSRGVVLRRRLPRRFGRLPIYVTPEASLRYWFSMSAVDPLLYTMAEELVRPGSVVWDIGANVGLFSLCAAARCGTSGFVLAVEPDIWLANLVIRSASQLAAKQFSCAEVKLLCAAISDSIEVTGLCIAERQRASNHLTQTQRSMHSGNTRPLQPTACLTLDFLLTQFPPPSVLKIDVESHEVRVLKGARKLLQEVKPLIWCEVLRENSSEVTSLLREAGYELYGAESTPHERISRAWFHTLAIAGPQ
ncbi:MAG: FkbM family methyltransferase [Acidobacteriaceae bacterium]|nr:FkbM family methyltransferase [Acidobacteriaceae bacterium]